MAERRVGWGGHTGVMRLLAVSGALLLAVSAQPQQPLKLKVGSDVTLVPQYTGDPAEINWKINSNKLVDMERKPQVDFKFYRLEDRATIYENGSLTIKNLTIGDSGDYRAEALVNNIYQNTDIRLDVLDCPAQPIITVQSAEDKIKLHCESSTGGVTYHWRKNEISVGTDQIYTAPGPTEDVTLTCVVRNEVCEKSSTKTIAYIPDPSGLSGWIIALIIIVILLIYIIAIAVLYYFRENDLAKRIFSVLTCCFCGPFVEQLIGEVIGFCCNSKNKGPNQRENDDQKQEHVDFIQEGHNHRDNEQRQELVDFIQEGHNHRDNEQRQELVPFIGEGEEHVEEGNAAAAVDQKVESDSCGSISLNLSSTGTVKRVVFQKDVVPSIDADVGELNGQPQRIISLRLTVDGVETEDHGDYTAEALLSSGEVRTLSIEGNDEVVINKSAGNQVTFTIPKTQNLQRLSWKKGGTTLFEWAFLGVQLRANNIILGPESVTVNDLEPGDSGFYEIEVHSTDNSITKNAFQLEVVKQVDQSQKKRKINLMVKFPKNGHPENQPIRSITFHPIKMSNKTEITWKKGDQPVDINGERIKSDPNGYLTINNVTHEDQGEYTVHCEDQELKQEFILRL